MNRILAFDYGAKRIGVAISDPLQIIASDLGIIQNTSRASVLADIGDILNAYPIEKIVIGLPLNMNSSEGFQAQIVREFGQELEQFNIPIIYVDERESSVKAESILKELKVDKKTIRYNSDKKAASIILQDYLDYQN